VTLTEIEEGVEWNWPDPGNLEDEVTASLKDEVTAGPNTDEIFQSLDGIVQARITQLLPERKYIKLNR
jgi:hypothetical protein